VTGAPIWPIEERLVPKGDVPGEWYSPTQPFPTRPPAYDRQGLTPDDLIDFTPELRAEALKLIAGYKTGPLFTPPVVSRIEGPLATLLLPSEVGGTNWPGGSYDPETHILYVFSQTNAASISLVRSPDSKTSDMRYVQGNARSGVRKSGGVGEASATPSTTTAAVDTGGDTAAPVTTVRGLPLVKPPYGRISAIDLDKGNILWQIAHGETPDYIRNSPLLKGLTIPRTGQKGYIGTLVTKTLLIAGEPAFTTTPSGRGAMLRAYNKATGTEVGAVYMPAPQSGSPMTYMLNGKQYIVLAIGGGNYSGELLAFRLPG
jgi:quinoprotein glucose dehydrogenase